MTTQPEALRLADACDTLTKLMLVVPGLDTIETAAELRRLHEVNTRLCRKANTLTIQSARDAEKIAALEAINQELLAVLETLHYEYASHGNHAYCQVGTEEDLLKLVEAAIAKAERTTT